MILAPRFIDDEAIEVRDDPGAWVESYGSIVLKDGSVVEPGEVRLNFMQQQMVRVRARCIELGLPIRILNLNLHNIPLLHGLRDVTQVNLAVNLRRIRV